MGNGYEQLKKHMERMEVMDNGGKIKCPNCKDGYIRKVEEGIYLCNKCKCGIVSRMPLDLPA